MPSPASKPGNSAAWLPGPKSRLEVKPAPYTSPSSNQIVIRNSAVAINPVDWIIPEMGSMMYKWIKYPFIVGSDTSGTVVEVGEAVTRFKVGDRVVGFAVGTCEKVNRSSEGAFQNYVVLLEHMTSRIPDSMSFESAAVLPLGVCTASCGLFQQDQLAMQLPSLLPKPTGQTILVWGGSTSVGSNAIQLAKAAGYEVITTCSPHNFQYVKDLGASQAFDYNSKTIIKDLISAFKGKITAGALTIGAGGAEASFDVLHHCKGNKFIAMASYPTPEPRPTSFVLLKTIWAFATFNILALWKGKTRGIGSKFIFGDTLVNNGIGKAVFEEFLGEAIANGTFLAKPEPLVVGNGLEKIQEGFDMQKKGVSAKKVVVLL